MCSQQSMESVMEFLSRITQRASVKRSLLHYTKRAQPNVFLRTFVIYFFEEMFPENILSGHKTNLSRTGLF